MLQLARDLAVKSGRPEKRELEDPVEMSQARTMALKMMNTTIRLQEIYEGLTLAVGSGESKDEKMQRQGAAILQLPHALKDQLKEGATLVPKDTFLSAKTRDWNQHWYYCEFREMEDCRTPERAQQTHNAIEKNGLGETSVGYVWIDVYLESYVQGTHHKN